MEKGLAVGDGVRSWVRPRKGPTMNSRRCQPTEKKSAARLRNPGGVDARGRQNPDAIPANNVTLSEDCTTSAGLLRCFCPVLVSVGWHLRLLKVLPSGQLTKPLGSRLWGNAPDSGAAQGCAGAALRASNVQTPGRIMRQRLMRSV